MSYRLNLEKIKRSRPPAGGWIYHEIATGWTAPMPMSDDFETTISKIEKHRSANPAYGLSTSRSDIASDLMDQTARRIIATCPEHGPAWVIPGSDEEKKNSEKSGSMPPRGQPVAPAARKAGAIERTLSRIRGISRGAATLAAWIGEGSVPVAEFIANHRAEICAACPNNRPAEGFSDRITTSIAEAIRSQTIVKNALDLRTTTEDKLGMCDVCGCPLRLKVWVPLVNVLENTPAEELSQFPEHCWIPNEG